MSIPPYPSRDLAKLVLGYLAEEQLMTVYDEFLLASPYLDAHVNEFERLNMKSLRSLVSESWAVKIYVEKCKPYSLRKKLLQFSNLLEVFKFLVSNFDLKTIQPCSTNTEKNGAQTSHISNVSRSREFEEEFQQRKSPNQENQNDAVPTTSNLVEATSLADLPGNTNHNIRRKHMRVLDKDGPEAARLEAHSEDTEETSSEHHSYTSAPPQSQTFDSGSNVMCVQGNVHYPSSYCVNPCNEMIGAVKNNSNLISDTRGISTTEGTSQNTLLQTGNNGEKAAEAHINMSIPVSSTSEFRNNLSSTKPDFSSQIPSTAPANKPPYLFQVTHPNNLLIQSSDSISNHSSKSSEDSKIRILSDIKVDGKTKPCVSSNKELKPLSVLQNAKSPPRMQMQTIVINGTPAYKGYQARKVAFTRDEIMAMPTVILVSAPGPSTTTSTVATSEPATASVSVSSGTAAAPSLGPLTIDISSSPAAPSEKPEQAGEPETNSNLVTTVDLKNASVPKDSIISVLGKTSTPQVLPPARKSSSTPRRSSHIRVLDFTTPRRILHETINENPGQVEVIVSRSPNLHIPDVPFPGESVESDTQVLEVLPLDKNTDNESSTKENKTTAIVKSKSNWDADLRALALASVPPEPKPPAKRVRKKKIPGEITVETNKKTPRGRISKKKKRLPIETTKVDPLVEKGVKDKAEEKVVVETAVKPTINIITEWKNPTQEAQTETKNKSKEDTSADTPEMDRVSLQNALGAKLNISDLFETPYKQALYDIQMDTPKFLRPDIPIADEPVSEIKITDIPTPRFLIESPAYGPKTSQATPSSYSSRPTDYSSGGSYYKPDEQDYIPHPDDLGSPIKYVDISKPDENKDKNRRSSRPVRQCTKNVKYSDVKEKTSEKSCDVDVTTVDNSSQTNVDSSSESNEVDRRKYVKKIDTKINPKADNKRKSSITNRKRKTPVKKATPKTFMKIKPRRPTPVKENKRKSSVSESLQRKRTTSKEKASFATPPITPAPTKSRRKSSTPRKLHTKVLTSSSESPENNLTTQKVDTGKCIAPTVVDSDTDNIPLRWSDDCSLDGKPKETETSSFNGSEDILQIKAYLEQSMKNTNEKIGEGELGSLHIDLIKRGFDIETAKSIERDLLDSPVLAASEPSNAINAPKEIAKELKKGGDDNFANEVLDKTVSDSSVSNNLVVVQDESEDEEEELSNYQCHEGDANYITYIFDETAEHPKREVHTLKENFTMEFCMEGEGAIRLQTTSLQVYLDKEPTDVMEVTETEPVTRMDYNSMNTPMKESFHAQCRDLFDSTLASLDTPLKADTSMRAEASISEIVLEVEKIEEVKEKMKKRKRASGSSSEDSLVDGKRTKRDASLMRNIDIETVLSKLHGP